MLKNRILIIVFGLLAFAGCKKNELEMPSFDVSVTKTNYKVGDTVYFNFAGNPDFITFYSGELGRRYENISRITAKGIPKLQFTSLRSNGTQPGSLLLMISNDFAGVAVGDTVKTLANMAKAAWTDITAKAALSTGASTPSGILDLSEFANPGKPVHIAFKYIGATGSIQNKWTITGLTVTNTLPDASVYTIANLTNSAITNYNVANTFSPGWVTYKPANNYSWVISTGTSLVITGATDLMQVAPAESWVFTGPLDLSKVTPEQGVFVKGMDSRKAAYTYVYTTPGTYNAIFTAANRKLNEAEEITRKLSITVTP